MSGEKQKNLAYYRLDTGAVLDQLRTSREGLSNSEANTRLGQYGPNQLMRTKRETWVEKYVRQFQDFMIVLLLMSSIIALFLNDGRTAIVLMILVLFNTTLGFFQEYKAERTMESLENLIVPEASVLRAGKLEPVAATDLVIGDIVYIEEGNSVPTDLRLIEESELATNDFALTGESQPSRKFTHAISGNVELANRHNLIFMGTTVATGHGYGVVIGTGMQTELGRIASLSQEAKSGPSPLQKEMNNIAKRVTQGVVLLCCVLLLLSIQADLPLRDAFLFAIGFASALVPNGLPAAISTVLAQAAKRLAESKALVKKLSAVETLGATSIICTDKTGTLTKNQMTVESIFIGKEHYKVSGSGYEAQGDFLNPAGKKIAKSQLEDLKLFFSAGIFASNALINPPDEEHAGWYVLGDPTEGALITLANKAGLSSKDLSQTSPELKEFSFDSARKRMSSVRDYGPDRLRYVFVKGAPESVLDRCEDIWDHGHVRKLTAKDRTFILDINENQAGNAMRNLVLAYKVLPAKTKLEKLSMEEAESGLTYLGMVSMIDPLRDEVPEAMDAAHAAHVKVSIITGDFATTAEAIAKRARLAYGDEKLIVITGEELRNLDDARLLQLLIRGGTVFSRVSPEDKLRIVELVKSHGIIVAVTGDGINDAPALKRADIGVAMGVTGTDVAKQSAEIVLLDDSFKTLVKAIQQGRVIFANIKKIALMCFVANASELFVNLASLAGALIFGAPLALSVILILAIDLIAELFPVAALGWDIADHELMDEPPRDPKVHILNKSSIIDILFRGLIIGGLAYLNFVWFFYRSGNTPSDVLGGSTLHAGAMTITYVTIVMCQWVNILQSRTAKGIFTRYQFHNKRLWVAFAFSLICVLNIIYNPLITPYFGTASLTVADWAYTLGAAGLFLLIREVQRHADTHHTREHILSLLKEDA